MHLLSIEKPNKNDLNISCLTFSMFSYTKLCSHGKSDRILKGFPYFAIAGEYPTKKISFRLFVATNAHNTKWL
jgi:hypothetical protein